MFSAHRQVIAQRLLFVVGLTIAFLLIKSSVAGLFGNEARVIGRVRVGSHPLRNVTLRVSSTALAAPISVKTDEDGYYALSLPEAALYQLDMRILPHVSSRSFAVAIPDGTSRVDLDLPETAVQVRVVDALGSVPKSPIQLHYEGPIGSTEYQMGSGVLTAQQQGVVHFPGWRPGRYRISADTADGLTGAIEVMASEQTGAPTQATIRLASRGGLVRVFDSDERPIDADIRVNGALLEGTAGTGYNLSRVSPGQRLIVRANGALPICRTLRDDDWPVATVRLQRFSEQVAINMNYRGKAPVGGIMGLPGSDCEVPLSVLDTQVIAKSSGLRLFVRGLPRGHFTYVAGPGRPSQGISLPADGDSSVNVPNDIDSCRRWLLRAQPAE